MILGQNFPRPLLWAAAALGFGFLLLLLVGVSAVWIVLQYESETRSIGETREAKLLASDLMVELRSAEAGQRGFLLTLDPSYRESYEAGRRGAPEVLAALRRRGEESPSQAERLARIASLVERRLNEIADTLALADAGNVEEARAIVRTNRGRASMDALKAELDEFQAEEDRRLAEGIARRVTLNRWLFGLIAAALAGIAGIAVASAVVIYRAFAALHTTQDELTGLNEGLEETVRERTGDLQRANAEIQRFAYIVSHDLRSPLVNVMGFTAELEQALSPIRELVARVEAEAPGLASPEAKLAVEQDVPEALRYIQASTAKMDRLIGAILRLSREGRRPLALEQLDLSALAQGSADALKKLADERGATITVERLPRIMNDRLSLEQVLSNLLENAIKYGAPDRPNEIVVRGEEHPREVVIEVSDTGRGIGAEDRERVFELFRRAGAQDQPGEGLGLAFVRAIVRRMGGDVELDSEVNRGTTFRIRLPRVLRMERRQEAAQ